MYWLTEGQAPVDAKVGLALLEFPEVCSFFSLSLVGLLTI